jgi:STE24 endopeptidase
MATSVSVAIILTSVAGSVALYFALRAWARQVESSPATTTERAHRLRRGTMAATFVITGVALVLFAWFLLGGAIPRASSSSAPAGNSPELLFLAAFIVYFGGMTATRRAVRPAMARVRDIDQKVGNRGRQLAVGLLSFAVVAIGFGALIVLAPSHGDGRAIWIASGYVLLLFTVNGLLAPLWPTALGARQLPPITHRRLMALSKRLNGRVRDVRAYPSRAQRSANAMQVGILPGLRYILVSDYLLDNMTADEVDAVVAHEIGHAKGNHIAIKLVGTAVVWAALMGVTGGFANGADHAGGLLAAAFPLEFLIALFAVRGLIGIRLERNADDTAARSVDPVHLATALERLGELNHSRMHTSAIWNVLTQHPGLSARIERLEVEDRTPVSLVGGPTVGDGRPS